MKAWSPSEFCSAQVFFKFIHSFTFGGAGSSGFVWTFSSGGEQGLLFVVLLRLLNAMPSPVVKLGL